MITKKQVFADLNAMQASVLGYPKCPISNINNFVASCQTQQTIQLWGTS